MISETDSLQKMGIVTSPHPLASQIGADVLKKGGTAIEARLRSARR